MLRSWLVVVAVVLVGPRVLKLLNRLLGRTRLQRLPLELVRYEPESEESIPPSIRSGFEEIVGELKALGFVGAGAMCLPEPLPEAPRHYAVLWHPDGRAFAAVHYRAVVPPLGLTVDFVTLFEDGDWVWTLRGRGYVFIGDFASGRLVDTPDADTAERWRAHQAAIGEDGRQPRAAELADLCAFQSAREEEEIRLGVARGHIVPTNDPRRFHLNAAGARALQRRHEEGLKRTVAFAGWGEAAFAKIPPEELERHYRMAARYEELTRGPTWPLFALSAVAFVASMALMGSWSIVAWLIPVLLFHELGHWAAMRLLGHRDAWIAFIPFLGAATISKKNFERLSHELIVLLAGPVPGIILALGLVFFQTVSGFTHPGLTQLGVLLLGINIFNLLPIHPLDGGRILHALVTAGRPRLALALKILAAGAASLATIALRDATIALFAALSIYAVWQEGKRLGVETAIRCAPGFADSTSAEGRRRFIFMALRGKPQGAPARWLASVRQLEVPLSHTKSQHWWTIAAGVAYLAAFAAGGAAIMRFGSLNRDPMTCPTRDRARALSCANPTLAARDWTNVSPPRSGLWRGPRRATQPAFPHAAFVWCQLDDDQARNALLGRLEDAMTADTVEDCSLPWQSPASPSAGCARLWISNIATADQGQAAPAGPRATAKEIPRSPLPAHAVRFSVRFRAVEDFSPVGPYLCDLGCRVDVLPVAADDLHVDVCF